MAAMNPSGQLDKKLRTKATSWKKNVEQEVQNVELSEKHPAAIAQPFKSENRVRFKQLATSNVPLSTASAAKEKKENESLKDMLKTRETENMILELQRENARTKEAPPLHGQLHPPPPSHL